MKVLTLCVAAAVLTSSLGADEPAVNCFCPIENEMHILERLVVSFPENEQNNWTMIHSNESDRGMMEIWDKENGERLTLVTAPWDHSGQANAIDAIDAIAHYFKDHIEVVRRTKGEDEIVLVLKQDSSFQFFRVITTAYALHIASWANVKEMDLEKALARFDEYVQIVY